MSLEHETGPNGAIRDALEEVTGGGVVGTIWTIGMAEDAGYFVSERWDNPTGGWTSWHASLTDCLDDLRERIETERVS